MSSKRLIRSPWVGFLVGLVVVALPVAIFFGARAVKRQVEKSRRAALMAEISRAGSGQQDGALLGAGLRESGASLPDRDPEPGIASLDAALARGEAWLAAHQVDPFSGSGTQGLRVYALEIESRFRLARAGGIEAARREARLRERLGPFFDPQRLVDAIQQQGDLQGAWELLLVAARCRQSGIEIEPIRPILEALAPPVRAQMLQMPPGIAALYRAGFAAAGIDTPLPSPSEGSTRTVLARRPREVQTTLADIYGLTQEVHARAGIEELVRVPFTDAEKAYLRRALPFWLLAHTLFRNTEITADLASSLCLVGFTDCYGYREGLRRMIERQGADGSFGHPGGPDDPAPPPEAIYAATSSCLGALCRERERLAGSGS